MMFPSVRSEELTETDKHLSGPPLKTKLKPIFFELRSSILSRSQPCLQFICCVSGVSLSPVSSVLPLVLLSFSQLPDCCPAYMPAPICTPAIHQLIYSAVYQPRFFIHSSPGRCFSHCGRSRPRPL